MTQYTKLGWLLRAAGLLMYVADMCTDIALVLTYFKEKHYLPAALTLLFIVVGLLVTQIFSLAWYWDDMNCALTRGELKTTLPGGSKRGLVTLHLLGVGIFIRYYQMLKRGFGVAWRTAEYPVEEIKQQHHFVCSLAADLSMLRLLEAFLESVPQLLLQLYVVLGRQECSLVQILGMSFSFVNAAWALVDYRQCLRRSLPDVKKMPCGLPTAIYLFYKLFTITSHVLGYALLLIFSIYCTVGLAIVWLLGTAWTHCLHTDFCSSRSLEFLYRAVVGVILTFTFFNVKGQGTKDAMITYYFFHSLISMSSPLPLFLLRPELLTLSALLGISALMAACSVLGLVCLVLYYLLLHPTEACREEDEVDSLEIKTKSKGRIKNFLSR